LGGPVSADHAETLLAEIRAIALMAEAG
jgi:hypothetical protein